MKKSLKKPMKVKIKRIDTSIPLPKYETEGSVAIDLLIRVDTTIPPKQIALIPANCIIETPPGYALILAPRSSMPKKRGLNFPHSIGVIDQDYCGTEDEILIQVYNFTDQVVTVNKGDKICQAMFVRVDKVVWEEVDHIDKSTRGGVGSTDQKK